MPQDVIKDIELLDNEQLEELILAVIDMTNLTDLQSWLVTQPVETEALVS